MWHRRCWPLRNDVLPALPALILFEFLNAGFDFLSGPVVTVVKVMGELVAGLAEGEGADTDHPDHECDQVEAVDDGVGEEATLFGDVGLMPVGEHVEGEVEVKGPGDADKKEEEVVIGVEVSEEISNRVKGDDENGVEGEKVGGEGDEKVGFGEFDVAAFLGDVDFADAGAHTKSPECVGEFVSEHVGANGFGENQQ